VCIIANSKTKYRPFYDRTPEEEAKHPRKESVPTHRECIHCDVRRKYCIRRGVYVQVGEIRCKNFVYN